MNSLTERLTQAQFEIDDLRNHRNPLRLTHAFRELKDVMACAAIEGKISVLQHGTNIVTRIASFIPDDRVLVRMLADTYCDEFDPTPDMIQYVEHPSLNLHERLVDAYVLERHPQRAPDISSSIEKMLSAGHFKPLQKLTDWIFESFRNHSFSVANQDMSSMVKILNAIGLYGPWNVINEVGQEENSRGLGTFADFLGAMTKHSNTFSDLYEAQSLSDADALHGWASPEVIKGLMVTGNRENAELLFHEYCMTETDRDLIEFMIRAGIQPDPVMMQRKMDACYDASVGAYPQSAMLMHLASAGAIAVQIDFERIGGKPIARFIGKHCQIYGDQHAEVCIDLIDKFLEHNAMDGLATHGIPLRILEKRPDLAEECLAADMGL